jgi:hypothetical protein
MSAIETTKQKAEATVADASPWIESLGRWGYAAKGVIYVIIGVLAFMAASGDGGKTTDQKGVINTIAQHQFGQPLLIVLGIGLLGYCLFRLVMAGFNPEGRKAIKRIGYAVSGLAYGGFGVLALLAATGERAKDDSKQKAADVMAIPGGEWVIALIGAIMIGVGIAQLVNGSTAKFMKVLDTGRMSEEERKTAELAGRIGLIARGIVFLIVGGFFVWGAVNSDPSKTGGIDQALSAIAKLPYGALLLGATGIGLVMFGVYMFVQAKYRKFTPVQPGQHAAAH